MFMLSTAAIVAMGAGMLDFMNWMDWQEDHTRIKRVCKLSEWK